MTDEELWHAIYAHNQWQKKLDRKLAELRKLLPSPDRVLSALEMAALLRRLREITGK